MSGDKYCATHDQQYWIACDGCSLQRLLTLMRWFAPTVADAAGSHRDEAQGVEVVEGE